MRRGGLLLCSVVLLHALSAATARSLQQGDAAASGAAAPGPQHKKRKFVPYEQLQPPYGYPEQPDYSGGGYPDQQPPYQQPYEQEPNYQPYQPPYKERQHRKQPPPQEYAPPPEYYEAPPPERHYKAPPSEYKEQQPYKPSKPPSKKYGDDGGDDCEDEQQPGGDAPPMATTQPQPQPRAATPKQAARIGWSTFDLASKLYKPAYTDGTKAVYRAKIGFVSRPGAAYVFAPPAAGVPSPSPSWLVQGVNAGNAIDVPTGAVIGTWESFTITTQNVTGLRYSSMSNLVLELGPGGDDTLTLAGSAEADVTTKILDDDAAVTGGSHSFLGATGQFKANATVSTPTSVLGELVWIVPTLPAFAPAFGASS